MEAEGDGRVGRVVRGLLVLAILAVAYVNGFDVSPLFDAVQFYLTSFAPVMRSIHRDASFHLTSVALSMMTLLVAAIPAALYERARGLPRSTVVSLAIWLATAVLLTLPVILRLVGSGEE